MPAISITENFKKNLLFIACMALGLIAIYLTLPYAKNIRFSNSKQLLAFYIPLPFSLFYIVARAWQTKLTTRELLKGLILFLILLIPFYSLLFTTYDHYPKDDASRYRVVATHIAQHNSLWGADDLVYNSDNKVYMFQPGYRYYLAAWIKFFGRETRAFQLLNMFVYFAAIIAFISALPLHKMNEWIRKGILLFIFLSAPVAAKNIMLGLSEWLAVVIFIFSIVAILSNKRITAVLLLALLPFVRQNLLITSMILMLWLLINRKWQWSYLLLYVLILLLPLYHNLYYAGQWKFFSTYNSTDGYLVMEYTGSLLERIAKTIFYKILSYSGIDYHLQNFWANAIAVVCIPLGTFIYVKCILQFTANKRWLYLAVTLATIVPTLILGGQSYYPRFEWTNLMIALSSYVVLILFSDSRWTPSHPLPATRNP